ncbi:MAG: hypothetical protein WB952_14585 [Terriglobales bacterium]
MAKQRTSAQAKRKAGLTRERLRKRYLPARVRVLFVGEAPPASGRFFYQADSGLYRAIRDAFVRVFPAMGEREFLESFRALDCYLVDLCSRPVDRLPGGRRARACRNSESRLAGILQQLRPEVVISVVRSISANVMRSQGRAGWSGRFIELPYPGRWHHHRAAFIRGLALELRKTYRCRSAKSSFIT